MMVIDIWKFKSTGGFEVATVYGEIPYGAVLPQLSRHRSFSLSVGSSRALLLKRRFVPMWQAASGGMFGQGEVGKIKRLWANAIWSLCDFVTALGCKSLIVSGIHLQHAQLMRKPFVYVPIYITGSIHAWEHFFRLRISNEAQVEIRRFAEEIRDKMLSTVSKITPNNVIVGPYLEKPVNPRAITAFTGISVADRDTLDLAKAICKVGRITTGRHTLEVEDDFALRWVKRAYAMQHASVFEHHYMIDGQLRPTPLRKALSVRDMLWSSQLS